MGEKAARPAADCVTISSLAIERLAVDCVTSSSEIMTLLSNATKAYPRDTRPVASSRQATKAERHLSVYSVMIPRIIGARLSPLSGLAA